MAPLLTLIILVVEVKNRDESNFLLIVMQDVLFTASCHMQNPLNKKKTIDPHLGPRSRENGITNFTANVTCQHASKKFTKITQYSISLYSPVTRDAQTLILMG
ncbi:hypothetical protein ACJX0J_006500, partial [Zea mays]